MQYSSSVQGLPTPVFTKRYASPGIDDAGDFGVLSSGAGLLPGDITGIQKASPSDWSALNPDIGLSTGRLIGNNAGTQATPINETRSRKRGISPFGGYFPTGGPQRTIKVGGIADLNTGADSLIAGGKAQASSMVRFNGRNVKAMRLPVIPMQVTRGGIAKTPSGGQSPGFGPAVPTLPQLKQFPSIVRIS